MPIRHIGYCCINLSLGKDVSTNRGTILKKFSMERASDLSLKNCNDIIKILEWNNNKGIKLFRISSDIFPFLTHKDVGYPIESLRNFNYIESILEAAGSYAKWSGMRLNSHPGPFTVLASPNEEVVRSSIRDIEMHSRIFDLMGLSSTPLNNINFHVGGSFGNKQAAADRFCKAFENLSDSAKKRITIENDDRKSLFSVKDLYEMIYVRTGIPIVFDVHHHRFNSGGMTEEEAARIAFSTWNNYVPEVHYSESRHCSNSDIKFDRKVKETAHSDYILNPLPKYDWIEYDLTVEAKAKELAVLPYLNDNYNRSQSILQEIY